MPLVATLTTSFSRSSPDLGLWPLSPPPLPPPREPSSLTDRERPLPIPANPLLFAPMESGSRLTSGGEFLLPPLPLPVFPPKRPPLPPKEVETDSRRPLAPDPEMMLLYSSLMQAGIESVEILLLAFGRDGVAQALLPADVAEAEDAAAAAAADGK